jgi:hypothetical protein
MGSPTIPTPRKHGQRGPAHVPTAQRRIKVRRLAGYGVPQPDIARLIDTDPETLRRHYREDLDLGVAEANAKVGGWLLRRANKDSNPAAAIFWAKARMGWSDFSAEWRAMQVQQEQMQAELAALRAAKDGKAQE